MTFHEKAWIALLAMTLSLTVAAGYWTSFPVDKLPRMHISSSRISNGDDDFLKECMPMFSYADSLIPDNV